MTGSIGIDYSVTKAYIAVLPSKEVTCLVLDKSDVLSFYTAFKDVLDKAWDEHEATHVYIEQAQHMSEALEMGMMAARLDVMAQLAYFKTVFVHPSTWRKSVLSNWKASKQDAVDWAKATYGYEPPSLKVRSYDPDHNYCEALAIAHYGDLLKAVTTPLS